MGFTKVRLENLDVYEDLFPYFIFGILMNKKYKNK